MNDTMDEYGNLLYDFESDYSRYKVGMYGYHLMVPSQCDLCGFHTLYHKNPTQFWAYEENLTIIWHINLDDIWSREKTSMANNLRMMSLLISTCETSGFDL